MNHLSINVQPSDTLWYTPMEHHQQQQQPPHKSYPFFYSNNNDHHTPVKYEDVVEDSDNSSSNNANVDRSDTTTSSTTTAALDKEHMFEKPLTPSDVGKLNRLVIPKQHAEKYFPLAGVSTAAATTATGEASTASGGVLLGFEDEAGKCWRFRYSYWNSSQSYVLTKGWSRYVKEKKLDAGDVVLFERHRFDPDRFFIGWRRRGSNPVHHVSPAQAAAAASWTAPHHHSSYNYHHHNHQNAVQAQQHAYAASQQIAPASYPYPPESLHAGTEVRQERQKAKRAGDGNSKRVRLFGVNLECQLEDHDEQENDDEPQTSDGSSLSSQDPAFGSGSGLGSGLTMGPSSYNYFDYVGYPPNHHNHMDMNFPHDVNQMRNRLG